MQILKSDPKRHEITAAVYCCTSPDHPDSQNEYISKEDKSVLVDAEREFMKNPKFNIDHQGSISGIEVIKSWITDGPETIGGHLIGAEGACWIIQVAVPDNMYDELSQGNGISMGGVASYES